MECSKKILVFSYGLLLLLILLTLVADDKSALSTIVCAWIAECGAATGFYLWKSKNENRSKYAQKFIRQMAEQYGIESTARILDIVLKD